MVDARTVARLGEQGDDELRGLLTKLLFSDAATGPTGSRVFLEASGCPDNMSGTDLRGWAT